MVEGEKNFLDFVERHQLTFPTELCHTTLHLRLRLLGYVPSLSSYAILLTILGNQTHDATKRQPRSHYNVFCIYCNWWLVRRLFHASDIDLRWVNWSHMHADSCYDNLVAVQSTPLKYNICTNHNVDVYVPSYKRNVHSNDVSFGSYAMIIRATAD